MPFIDELNDKMSFLVVDLDQVFWDNVYGLQGLVEKHKKIIEAFASAECDSNPPILTLNVLLSWK